MMNEKNKVAEGLLEEIVELSADAILALDYEHNIIMFNHAAEKLFGYEADEVIGQSISLLVPDEIRSSHSDFIENFKYSEISSRAMNNRGSVAGVNKSGERIPLTISIQKHTHIEGVYFSAICRDVSTINAAYDALQTSETRLSRAQRIAQLGNWEWNILTGDLIWSDEIYSIFERSPDTFEATYENFLTTIHPDDRNMVSDYVDRCVRDHKPYSIVHRIICPDGKIKVVEEIGEVLLNERNEPIRMDGTVQDITEKWQKEEQLKLVTEQAVYANNVKTRFMSTMSHELRTPLNAIIGMSSMIDEEVLGPMKDHDYSDYIRDIHSSGIVLLNHINNILEISNLELEIKDEESQLTDSKDLIENSIMLVGRMAQTRGVDFSYSIDPDLLEINTVPKTFTKILLNLLSNAVKFSNKKGKVEIGLEKAESENKICLIVRDYGVGIAQDKIDNLFEPFIQGDMEFTRHFDGAGLGLSVVQRLVSQLRGEVLIESVEGEGTSVTIKIDNKKPA